MRNFRIRNLSGRALWLWLLLWASGINPSLGALMISVGAITLAPDTPNQLIPIYVLNSGPQVSATLGVQFNAEVEGGAPAAAAPKIMDVEILSLTIFQGDNTGTTGGAVNLFRWEVGTLENISQPDPPGTPEVPLGTSLVATINFDTTGVGPGTYSLSLTTPAGATDYFDDKGKRLNAQLLDGSITVVPEPAVGTLLLAGLGLLLLAGRRRKPENRC
ncbi:MAG: PEP-CTERM sorting domain-containing protein [Verrucomicrobiae bacterium]|nr:PEP-CTERM sorting domain-containing protein [Verrucomicrobiae bacterium]